MNATTLIGVLASPVLAVTLPIEAALAVGIQALNVPAQGSSPPLSGAVWYPCATAPSPTLVGPFVLSVSKDCPIDGTKLPLIVVSHGRTGSFMSHRDTAQALADAGFVVAAISHPGDNAQDSSRTDELSVFVERAADIRRLVDYLLDSWNHASVIDPNRIGVFGFSRGGYTGLVIVGADPYFRRDLRMCAGKTGPLCEEVHQGKLAPLAHDARIKAAVIADPLSVFFTKDSFGNVRVPIQLWRSEQGGDGVTPDSVALVAESLSVKPDFHTVGNARHFAFLPPCTAAVAAQMRDLCSDPQGFDRTEFHLQFNASVVEFFRHALRRD
jgi:predicted dienelactone hydrolase